MVFMDFRFYIAGDRKPLTKAHPKWTKPLPVAAEHFGQIAKAPPTITYGDYFKTVSAYFNDIGASHLAEAHHEISACRQIDIVLEKHGAFYHPARIVIVDAGRRERWLALNVAVTPVGLEVMESEMAAMCRVRSRMPEGILPGVYGQAWIEGPDGIRYGMLLTEWLRGFHEFHLARDRRTGTLGVRVWDPLAPDTFLNAVQEADLYRQAAELLARAYDPETTAQIYPWHHASGDFVLRVDTAGVTLKLISVRQYASTLATERGDSPDSDGQTLALLVFFLNTTLRLRLDRLDGTGPLAWAGAAAVPAAVKGLFSGLAEPWCQILRQSLAGLKPSHYGELLRAVAERYQLMPGESTLLAREIDAHAALLLAAVAAEA